MEIQYTKQSVKFLQKQPVYIQRRIVKAIERLPLGDVKKMQGEPFYRLRIGDVRVIFEREQSCIIVKRIASRGEIYKA